MKSLKKTLNFILVIATSFSIIFKSNQIHAAIVQEYVNDNDLFYESTSTSMSSSSFIMSETTPPTSHLMIYLQKQENSNESGGSGVDLFDSSFDIQIVTDKIDVNDKEFSDVPASTLNKEISNKNLTTLTFNDAYENNNNNNNNLEEQMLLHNRNLSDFYYETKIDDSNSKVKWIHLSEMADLIDYVNTQEVIN